MWQSVTCPQLKSVKRLCIALIVACACGLYFRVHISWFVAGIIAFIMIMLAIRATLIQQQHNREPWNYGGKECNFSEKE